jgi:SNF2 family DNA or RNA helicase
MKTYGKLRLVASGNASFWEFEAQPHVNIRLKQVFGRIDKQQYGRIRIQNTPETCRDVQWFCERFPMEMEPDTRRRLNSGAKEHRETAELLNNLLRPDYKPRTFALAKPLRDYQARGVEVYLATRGLLLGDQLGLGKTVTAIGSFATGETLPALVVCPTHLAWQWRDYLHTFMPEASAHVVKKTKQYETPTVDVTIITYSKLAMCADWIGTAGFKSIIFDEVQELRHHSSAKYAAAMALRTPCSYAMGLSATPIFNYGGEIFNILEILSPGRIGSRTEFYNEWCSFQGNDRWLIKDPVAFGEYMRDEFLMLRRRREDVGLELPKVERSVVTVPHDPHILKQLESGATELARIVMEGSFTESGQASRELDAKLRKATGVSKAPFVAEFVRMLVDNGEKVLLFGWHREVYSVWMERLKDLRPVLYTGTESPVQKRLALDAFKTNSQVLIMSLRSGSGVDGIQTVCNTAVFGELDWSPGVHEQCIGRLNRDGLTGGVLSYVCVSEAGSDPVVSTVLGLKKSQAVGLVDPDKGTEIESLQIDTHRMKKLAEDYLAKRGQAIPEPRTAAPITLEAPQLALL